MVKRTAILRFLVRSDRILSIFLLVAMILFFITGYSMTGKYGFNDVVDTASAIQLHISVCWVVIVLLAYHVAVRGYLEMRRIGLFGRIKGLKGSEEKAQEEK